LYNLDYLNNGGFVGFNNYLNLLLDREILSSFLRTCAITLSAAAISLIVGLVFALWIDRRTGFLAYIIQLCGLLPWVISIVVGALLWRWILNGDLGLLNFFLRFLGLEPVMIFTNKFSAQIALTLVIAWRTIGYSMVMILAGLKGIPREMIESAQVDGANPWQILYHIKLSLIRTPMLVSSVVLTMSNFNNNTLPLILSGGGPGTATNVITLALYNMGFKYYKFGSAAALAFLVFLLSMVLIVAYIKMVRYEI
jgi:ABC-type sugar transport system permease subunit